MTPDRQVDPEQTLLTGEAAGQQRAPDQSGYPVPRPDADHRRPDRAIEGSDPGPSYYDQPVIKEPVWIWSVPAYFYSGGLAAGAALVGAAAQIVDRDGLDRLITRSRWLAMAGTTTGTAFLIHDLGRPARFLNMLRVFRPSSAMSMGSWTLAASGTAAAAAAVLPRLGARRLGDVAGMGVGLLAPVLGTYTAVLISDTAVPVWQATRTSMPRFFAASGTTAAASALELFPDVGDRDAAIVRRLGITSKVADLVTSELVQRRADAVERVGRPLHEGASGAMWRAAKGCTAASLALSLLPVPQRWRRARRLTSAVLGTAGSMLGRFAVFHAGTSSARDPRATFHLQRQGGGAAEVEGHAAVTGPDARRATEPAT
jgi:hypothetical protein